jgi:hypothetical protein
LRRVSKDSYFLGRACCHPSRRPPIEIGCCRFRHFALPKSGRPDFSGRPPQMRAVGIVGKLDVVAGERLPSYANGVQYF